MRAHVVHSHIDVIEAIISSSVLDRPEIEETIAFAIFIFDRILKLSEQSHALCCWLTVATPLTTVGLELEAESKIPIPELDRLVEAQYSTRVIVFPRQGDPRPSAYVLIEEDEGA